MAGPSPYNRKLKAKNDRRKARAARGGRTPSEAALGRSMAAAGNRVSKSNQRATAPPSTRTFKSERKPVRAKRVTPAPVSRRNPPANAGGGGLDEIVDKVVDVATTPIAPTTANLSTSERAELATFAIPGVGVAGKASKVPKVVSAVKKVLGAGSKGKPKPILPKPPKAKPKPRPKKKKARRKPERKPSKTGGTVRRVGGVVTRTPKRNPIITAAAASVAADEAGVGGEITRRAADSTRGVVDALNPMNAEGKFDPLWFGEDSKDSPLGRTAGTTFRAVPGAIAGLAQIPAAAAETTYRGVRKGAAEAGKATGSPLLENVGEDYTGKEIASPVADTASEIGKAAYQMGKPFVEGDREGVSRVVEEELGFAPAVLAPRTFRAIRRSKGYQGARGAARDAATRRRDRKQEEARSQKQREDRQGGQSDVIVPPNRRTDSQSRRGDEYIIQGLGRRIENRRTARRMKREGELGIRPVTREVQEITKDIYRTLVRAGKKPKGMSRNEFRQMLAATLTVAVQQPITAGRSAASLAYLERMVAKQTKTDEPSAPGAVYDRRVVEFLKENPKLLDDPAFAAAVEKAVAYTREGTRRTKGEGGGERARYEPAADVYGIALPEVRVAQGVVVGGRTIRFKDMKPETRERWEGQAKDASITVRELDRQIAKLPEGPQKMILQERRNQVKARGDKLRNQLRDYRAAYAKAEKDFVDETRAAIQRDGLDPDNIGYVRDASRPKPEEMSKAGIENFYRGNVINDPKRRSGGLRRQNRADRSGDTFVGESLMRPRMMEAVNAMSRAFFTRNSVRIGTARGKSIYATSREWAAAAARGEVPVGTVLVHAQFVKGAFRGRMAATDGRKFEVDENGLPVARTVQQARKDVKDRTTDPGQKYVAVDKKAWDEFMYQIGGPRGAVVRGTSRANRIASTAILGYNPSWAAAQVLAEGLPAFAAIGLGPGAWRAVFQGGRAYKNMTPKERADLDAVTGSAGGTLRQLGNIRNRYGELDYDLVRMPQWAKNSRLYRRLSPRRPNSADMDDMVAGVSGRAARELKDLAKGRSLNEFVLWFGGKYRRAVFSAEVYRRQQRGLVGLARATLKMKAIDKKLQGMSTRDAQLYLARNPREAARLADYMEDVMGNWTALSKVEGAIAPWVAFYPYLRYSLRWTFYGFPRRHPIRASILYFLAQQNANQLEKMLGGKPSVWLDYAFPVITVDGEQQSIPGGARISPALSALVESVGLDDPQKLLTAINPVVGAVARGFTGTDPFTGEREAYGWLDQPLLVLAGLAYMAAPVRWSDQLLFGGRQEGGGTVNRVKPRKDWSQGPFSKESVIGGEPSDTSKEFREADPGGQINDLLDLFGSRSSLNILRPRSAEEARRIEELRRGLSGGSSSSSRSSSTPTTPWWMR